MNKLYFFERNLLALDRDGGDLCERLSQAVTTYKRYRMLESQGGEAVPSLEDSSGKAYPLHSLIDPIKEAERLAATITGSGFLIFLGLGGGFQIEAALKNTQIEKVLIIDYDINGIAELLSSKNYVHIFNDSRVLFLANPTVQEITKVVLENYKPLLHGALRSIPLRARCEFEKDKFIPAADAVNEAIEKISIDYSVQSQFGKLWFSNIIHNIKQIENQSAALPPVFRAAVCAAGPSLDKQSGALKKKQSEYFIIATDTSLPSLLYNKIEPDAVISIDCQHISCAHFAGIPKIKSRLFLDIASPPCLAAVSAQFYFFASSHPLANYICKYYKPLPKVDTSGGNVTHAALSLAEQLSAKTIEIYGADFSYPEGKTYTKGAYIYPYFDCRQNRFYPLESLFSSFLFRSNALSKKTNGKNWFYQTPSLLMYKNSLTNYINNIHAQVSVIEGDGDVFSDFSKKNNLTVNSSQTFKVFSTGANKQSADEFLKFYYSAIKSLPPISGSVEAYLVQLTPFQYETFLTLLPLAASLKKESGIDVFADIFFLVKNYALEILGRYING